MPSNFRRMVLASVPRMSVETLEDRHFIITLAVAFLLHIMAVYAWNLMPKPEVIDIPVRALNIKLGDGDMPDEIPAQARAGNAADVESTISRLVRDVEVEKQRSETVTKSIDAAVSISNKPAKIPKADKAAKADKGKEGKFDVRSEGVKVAAPVMPVTARQFVRDLAPPAKVAAAPPASKPMAGNSNAKEAEMISRYEQMISLWIQKFKLYPTEARADGMQGETVVRIRIDRRGNIRYYALERTTGHQQLDRAAIDMVRRANPVPSVPVDYPPGDLLEFLIPVNFELQ